MQNLFCLICLIGIISCGNNIQHSNNRTSKNKQLQQNDSTLGSSNNKPTEIQQDGIKNQSAAGTVDTKPTDSIKPNPTTQPVNNSTTFQFADPIAHKTDFLTSGCLTHVYPGLDNGKRKNCRDAMKSRGYTHMYVYIYNEKDYGGPSFNYYDNPEGYITLLKELIDDKLTPIVWLFPDDASDIHGKNVNTLKDYLSKAIPKIDQYVGSYVLGLELDEYWGDDKVKPLGEHLNSLTQKKIGVHLLPDSTRFLDNSWADYLVFQYGFGKSEQVIESMTKSVITRAKGKPVVGGEYNDINSPEERSKKLGNIAKNAGAVGFGNGGTP